MFALLLAFVVTFSFNHDCDENELGEVRVIRAEEQHTHTMIWLAGLGDATEGWEQRMMIFAENFPYFKIILPVAPKQPITFTGKAQNIVAWFDFKKRGKRFAKFHCYEESYELIYDELIEKELSYGIPLERIWVGGFSQGGAMAIKFAQKLGDQLGGVVSMSGFLLDKNFDLEDDPETPIFISHGREDDRVPKAAAIRIKKTLVKNDFDVTMKLYTGLGHSANQKVVYDLLDFMLQKLEGISNWEPREVDEDFIPPHKRKTKQDKGEL